MTSVQWKVVSGAEQVMMKHYENISYNIMMKDFSKSSSKLGSVSPGMLSLLQLQYLINEI